LLFRLLVHGTPVVYIQSIDPSVTHFDYAQ
jgi:hypothetical protein